MLEQESDFPISKGHCCVGAQRKVEHDHEAHENVVLEVGKDGIKSLGVAGASDHVSNTVEEEDTEENDSNGHESFVIMNGPSGFSCIIQSVLINKISDLVCVNEYSFATGKHSQPL